MHPNLFESGATFLVLAVVALYVALRREHNSVHWMLLALLGAMMAWTGGLAGFYYCWPEYEDLARFSVTVAFTGVFIVPPGWLLLAARQTNVRLFDRSPGWLIAVLMPPAMTCLAVVTNPGHRLFVRDFDGELLQQHASEWAGPIFWVGIAWGVLLMLLGSGLYLAAAYRMISSGQRARGLLLGAIVAMPFVLSPLIALHTRRDSTPTLLGAMTVLLFVLNWRHRILDALPIARRDVIEHLADGVVLMDPEATILDANAAAEALLGEPIAELHGRSFALTLRALVEEGSRTELERCFGELLAHGGDTHLDLPLRGDRAVELNAGRVRGGDGETAGFYAVIRDRTEQRRQEHFLRQSHRLETVASLTAGIAHEVNNPLAFVRANLGHIARLCDLIGGELQEAGLPKREELDDLRQAAEESLEGVERIAATIERMSSFSRLHERELGQVDMNDVARDALRMARLRSGPELSVRQDLASLLPLVRGSYEHLVQAVLNLVVNARQAVASQPAAHLRIQTGRSGDMVELRVIDNGPGIPEELQERIFDPFYTTRRAGEASGLGLAVAYGIVREHRGHLDLESRTGRGSEFVIRLPVLSSGGAAVRGRAA